MKLPIQLLAIVLVLFTVSPVHATTPADASKKIDKEFSISADGTTSIDNRHGKVEINTWNQNKVKISVEIKVKASSQKAADELLSAY